MRPTGANELCPLLQGRKYLDYDLEALLVSLKRHESRRVIVAIQDSEAFDNAILTDLITLFKYVYHRRTVSVLSLREGKGANS